MQTTKAKMIYDYCKQQGWESFMWGDAQRLDRLYDAAGLQRRNSDPLKKWQAVLQICDQNSQTKKPFFRKVRVNLHGQGGMSFARRFYVL